jgi:Raf kinase inhibitor-like YbhB/YbcL family protein
MLIAAHAEVNAAGNDRTTALMCAASANRGDTVELLLDGGASVNARNTGGMTALMVGAFGGYLEPVRALLARKADPNAKDNKARTALMAAASQGDAAVVEALLAAGADPDAADADGGVALTYAAASGAAEVIDALVKRGARPSPSDLVLAAAGCHTAAVRVLLASGLSPNGLAGSTAPILAAARENCAEAAALLAGKGADVNIRDGDGRTPLIVAASASFVEVVRVLLRQGADMDVADRLERTAWMYAALRGREAIAGLFEAEKARRAAAAQAAPQTIVVESPTVKADQMIPRDYTADGRNVSPPLTWRGVPTGARELALVLEDPDAGNPPPFVHWVVYRIPPTAAAIPEGISIDPAAPMPAEIAGAIQGVSGFRRPIYRGPAPPPGRPHHYHFVVYALDTDLGLKPGLTRADLLAAIQGHVIAQGELVAIYERKAP